MESIRKTTSGPIRNKSRTKLKLINAVGEVLKNKGYSGLSAPNVAKVAGVDKKLVWTYFGGLDNLIEEYIELRAFWRLNIPNSVINKIVVDNEIDGDVASKLMQEYFIVFNEDEELQKIVHWEMGESKEVLRKVADKRELTGEYLFSLIEDKLDNSNSDMRATFALLLGGIYYLNLHAKVNGSKVCGIDINQENDKERVLKTIRNITSALF